MDNLRQHSGLISAKEAMRLLDVGSTEFYRLVEIERIERVIPPGYSKKGLYRKSDITQLIQKREEFYRKYNAVGE